MNSAPDWQDGECCFRCRTQFTLVARKHHCRNCGNIFCAKCSSQQIPLPKLNIEKNVRVCDTCYEKIASKNEDPLTLALDSSSKEQTRSKSADSKSTSSSKQLANASAPPEQALKDDQTLKEEEELQLALALSLSETPTKVSFPDCRHFEASSGPSASSLQAVTSELPKQSSMSSTPSTTTQSNANGISPQGASTHDKRVEITIPAINNVDQYATLNSSLSVLQQPALTSYLTTQSVQPPQPDYRVPERDLEVFRYVGEVMSTLEIFNNRLESSKLRNRPVSNDTTIQSMFLKLSAEFQPKLTEYIKNFEDERANYERLQDKLSQIADARAALDALREEHQEKVRQLAAEAERQRQSQLATKLEAMRQKKSEMMQYQRELAIQRIREQEMMLHQAQPPSTTGYQLSSSAIPTQIVSGQSTFDPTQQMHEHSSSTVTSQQSSTTVNQNWHVPVVDQHYSPTTQVNYVPNQQNLQQYQNAASHPSSQVPHSQQPYAPPPQPAIDRASIAQLERRFLPNSKPEEDAPLISFDD